MITYRTSADGVTADQLHPDFFDGWPNGPSPATHLEILANSAPIVLAFDGDVVVGFITALTDRVLYGEITLLEVVPAYKGRGIGRELVERVTAALGPLYRVDVAIADDVVEFYDRLGYRVTPDGHLASRTDYAYQPGRVRDGSPAQPRERSGA